VQPKGKISDLISQLGSSNSQLADAAGSRLIEEGPPILPFLLDAIRESPTAIRRRVAFLIGELAERLSSSPSAIDLALHLALDDDDWKVRRNAAISLGKVAHKASLSPILKRLRTEADERVRLSLILAFGNSANPGDAGMLKEVPLDSIKERAAAQKVFDRFRGLSGSSGKVKADDEITKGVTLELWSRWGVAEIAAEEAKERGLKAVAVAPDRVRILSSATLQQVTNVRSALHPLLVFETDNVDPGSLGRSFSASAVAREVARLTSDELPHYRLTLQGRPPGWPRRRDWIADFAANCKGLVNVATGYSWEIIARTGTRRTVLGVRAAACKDDRFSYRRVDVPAAIHPTLAAVAARLLPPVSSHIVLDPFCGSGTLLAERALRGPYRYLIGVDIDQRAIKAAQQNLQGFSRTFLVRSDVSHLGIGGPVDVIVSNPPYGRRVANLDRARRLHSELDHFAMMRLRVGGLLVVFRPSSFANPAGLEVIMKKRVDAGGIQVNIIVARKQ